MIPFPDKKYDIIYADPPWSYSDNGCNGNAADHYPTMTVEEICKLPVNVAGGGVLLLITAFCLCGPHIRCCAKPSK